MNKKIGAAILALIIALAAAWYFWLRPAEKLSEPMASAPVPQQVAPPAAITPLAPLAPTPAPAVIRYPLAGAALPGALTLPDLSRSDESFLMLIERRLLALMSGEAAIMRIVSTVDNLPRHKLPAEAMPLKPLPGRLLTTGKGPALALDPRNAARYRPYVAAIQAANVGQLVTIYRNFYPLFQQAYEALDEGNGYFNDRLVEALEDLLAAPEPASPVYLRRAAGAYVFADPALEARSAGQKLLIRAGNAHARAIKIRLREILDLVKQPATGPSAEAGR